MRRHAGPGVAASVLIALVAACQPGPTPTATVASSPSTALTATPAAPIQTALAPSGQASPVAAVLEWRLPMGITRAVALSDAGSVLVAGGLTAKGTTPDVREINLATGQIATIGRLAAPVHDAGGAMLGEMSAVFGGGDTVAESVVQGYRDGTVSVLGHLPHPRADLAAVGLDGSAYIVGGGTPARPDAAVLATTDGSTFRVIAKLPVPVRYAAVAVVGGSIIVVGGSDGTRDRSEIQSIDPASGAAVVVGQLPHGLSHASAVVIGGRLLIAGGREHGVAQDVIWEVDPRGGTARVVGHLPRAISDAASVVIQGIGYLVGGEDTDPLRSIISIALG